MTWSTPDDVAVVVAGGGPVGLSAAILLGRIGVPVLLAERRPTTCTHPKATVLNTRTMELFRQWGVEDAVRERGLPIDHCTAISWVTALNGFEIGQLDLLDGGAKLDEWLDQSPTLPAICPQDEIEPILRAHAESLPSAEICFGTEVTGFDDDGQGVNVSLRDSTGDRRRVRAQWLVAADGAQSAIRTQLGIGLAGTGPLGRLVNVYFHADLDPWVQRFPSVLYWIVNPEVRGVVHSLDGSGRWLLNAFVDPAVDAFGAYTADRCAELVRHAVGVPDLPVDVRSVKPWTMTALTADRYRVGRVVLAGDCAHQFPPTGGFGLNTGIQDVHNLAWKLAGTMCGFAGERLVDTYEAERSPIVRMNAEQTVRNARNIMEMLFEVVPDAAALCEDDARGAAMRHRIAAAIPAQREHFDFQGEALGAVYRSAAVVPDGTDPPWVANPITDYLPSAHPGARAPHARVRADGRECSIVDLFDKRFALLIGPRGTPWLEAARSVSDVAPVPLRTLRLTGDVELLEPVDEVLARYGIQADGAVLVRPDGHVAWREPSAIGRPGDRLRAAFAAILARYPAPVTKTGRSSHEPDQPHVGTGR